MRSRSSLLALAVAAALPPAASMIAEQVANGYLGKDTSFAAADLPEVSALRAFVAGDAKAISYVDTSAVDGSVRAVLKL